MAIMMVFKIQLKVWGLPFFGALEGKKILQVFMTLYTMSFLFGASKGFFGVSFFYYKAKRVNFLCYEQKQEFQSLGI